MGSRSKLFQLTVVAVFICVIAVCFGADTLNPFSLSQDDYLIVFSLRIPRVLMAFFAGGILSVCGAIYQALFQTPLASPFTLGVSSAASVGALCAQLFFPSLLTSSIVGGMIGAIISTVFIERVGRVLRGDIATQLLLMGLVVSLFCGSAVVILQYASDVRGLFQITRWLMGSVEVVGYHIPAIIILAAILLLVFVLGFTRELNLISIGHLFAETKGVEVNRVIRSLFFLTSLTIGILVCFCGPIGFVGIAVPFMARAVVGYHFENQLPASFILGGIFLTLCDLIGRTLLAPSEIPVGVVTALIGAPIFMMVLFKRR